MKHLCQMTTDEVLVELRDPLLCPMRQKELEVELSTARRQQDLKQIDRDIMDYNAKTMLPKGCGNG